MEEKILQYKRAPAKARKINKIDPEKDIRVRILGTVIDKSEDVLVIDDGSQKAEIVIDPSTDVSVGSIVRVFARVLPLESGFDLRAEIVQNMSGIDLELYNKIIR